MATRHPTRHLVVSGLLMLLAWAAPARADAVLERGLERLYHHLGGQDPLTAAELKTLVGVFAERGAGLTGHRVTQAFAVVERYETKHGGLFLNPKTRNRFKRSQFDGIELERVVFSLQQALLDHAYTANAVARDPKRFRFKFATADYFPGPCEPSPTPTQTVSTRVDATQIPGYGYPLNEDGAPARRPTGWYLPAGEVAVIRVPPQLVNRGYVIRVGAHAWNLEKRPSVARLDRVSLTYPITSNRVTIAHPLGGGVYVDVPWEADAGIVTLRAKNVVPAPFFSRRAWDPMTRADWAEQIARAGPWVDLETDRVMLQIPRAWAQAIEDPVALLAAYDKCMDLYSELTGRPPVRSKSVLYLQVDVIFRGVAFFPGYPQSNFRWDPMKPAIRKRDRWVIQGPHKAPSVLFHEMGHAHRITKFPGGVEAVVNFPYVYIHHHGYGVDLDKAFSRSIGNREQITLDQAAIGRMVTENFRAGRPANTTNRPGDEVKYQHRGYAVYADIVDLLGWEPLVAFWTQDQKNYLAGGSPGFASGRAFPKNINRDPVDSRILRLSIAAGVDLTPLCHFWGRPPQNPAMLRKALRRHKLGPSAAVYDKLLHYRTRVPMTRSAFRDHAQIMHPRVGKPGRTPNESNPLFGMGWYNAQLDAYGPEQGRRARQALDAIVHTYFPDGRP